MFAASGCSGAKPADSADGYTGPALDPEFTAETVRLATFNIEWLTADPLEGNMRRNDVDHGMITDLIEHIAPDVLGRFSSSRPVIDTRSCRQTSAMFWLQPDVLMAQAYLSGRLR